MVSIARNFSITLAAAGLAAGLSLPAAAGDIGGVLGGLGDTLGGVVSIDTSNGIGVSIGGPGGVNASIGGSGVSAAVGGLAEANVSAGHSGIGASASVGGGSVASVGASIGGHGIGASASVGSGSVADLDVSLGKNGLGLAGSVLGIGINRTNPGNSGPGRHDPSTGGHKPGAGTGGDAGQAAINPGRLGVMLAGMSSQEVVRMKRRCRDVVGQPASYDRGLVDLCRMLSQMASR